MLWITQGWAKILSVASRLILQTLELIAQVEDPFDTFQFSGLYKQFPFVVYGLVHVDLHLFFK